MPSSTSKLNFTASAACPKTKVPGFQKAAATGRTWPRLFLREAMNLVGAIRSDGVVGRGGQFLAKCLRCPVGPA